MVHGTLKQTWSSIVSGAQCSSSTVCQLDGIHTRLSNHLACSCVCMCVNQGGTNHNCYTYRLVILHGNLDTRPRQFPTHFPCEKLTLSHQKIYQNKTLDILPQIISPWTSLEHFFSWKNYPSPWKILPQMPARHHSPWAPFLKIFFVEIYLV